MKTALQFLLADDHMIVRKGLRQILLDEFDQSVITEAGNAREVIDFLDKKDFDLLICDITMPGINGLELCKQSKEIKPLMPVLVLSMHTEEQYAIRSLRVGASGYLTKDSAMDELIRAVRHILMGKKYVTSSLSSLMIDHIGKADQSELHALLSDRELEVLKLIASGQSLAKIGAKLHLSPNTISSYRARILEKMKMENNAQLIQYVLEHKL